MQEPTDALAEACKVAGIVAGEEQEIRDVEKQIADRFREICRTIFAQTNYRMPTALVGYCYCDTTGTQVWADVGSVLDDRITWDGDFHGRAQTLRVTTTGKLLAVWQNIGQCREYTLFEGDYPLPECDDYNQEIRPATDHEIATHAVELAEDLLDALRKRIDSAKDEKAELQRIAGLGGE